MRKSADVVIPMQLSSNYTLLYPRQIEWESYVQQKPDIPFADNVIEFLNALSGALLKDRMSRLYPDAITFAFFCRKANLLALKEKYTSADALRMGRGILFHIAPSNVPINFGYSLVAGLLAGNNNIVRVSSKQFPQVDLIIKHMHELMEGGQHDEVAKRIALVRYDRTSDASAFFSSIAAIHPDAVMAADDADIKKLAEAFYNDTYLFDQNACSAPHTIFWLKSDNLDAAKNRFWTAVHEHTIKKYELQAVMAVDKLTAFYRQAACMDVRKQEMPDNVVVRSELAELPKNIEDFRCACGYFSEYTIDSLDEIAPIISIKYQSLGYFGFSQEKLVEFVVRNRFHGLDRIVPIGETTAFSLTWDGCNLIEMFSRIPSVL